MASTIKEDQLRGIDAALRAHAPDLVPLLHEVMRNGAPVRPSLVPGSSIFATLVGNVPVPEGERILQALEAIEKKYGYNKQFAGRQINWLILCWKEFSTPKQIRPQS